MGMLWNAVSQSEEMCSGVGRQESERCFLSCPRARRVIFMERGWRHGDSEKSRRFPTGQEQLLLVSINTIINISHLLNNNEDVWRYLAPVCKNKTFCYIGEYEFSVDWAKSMMLDCLETWAVSNHSHMFSNVSFVSKCMFSCFS